VMEPRPGRKFIFVVRDPVAWRVGKLKIPPFLIRVEALKWRRKQEGKKVHFVFRRKGFDPTLSGRVVLWHLGLAVALHVPAFLLLLSGNDALDNPVSPTISVPVRVFHRYVVIWPKNTI